jgi:uncharacterized protein YecE (DUF72 family)
MTTSPSPSPFRIGPAGWSYPHWNGLVYPKGSRRGFHALEFLSGYFDVAEINHTFYAPLKPEVSRLWIRKVEANPRFAFTAKLGRRFTHERELDTASVAEFREGLLPFRDKGRLGALLMQFPWSFRFTGENRDFLIRLRSEFHDFPLVAEMRHASWMLDEARGVLIDYRIGFCNIDQPPYTKAMPPTSFLTSPVGYVRLHGRNCFNWYAEYGGETRSTHRYDYLYSPEELVEWKQRIDRVRAYAASTTVIFNNDGGAKALVNALQLQALVAGKPVPAPEELLREYRLELGEFPAKTVGQEPLFREFQAVA